MAFNIADLKLSTDASHYGLLASVSDDDTAMVSQGLVTSFTAGVSVQNKNDVMDSVLLAQLGASAAFNRLTQPQQWFDSYTNILGHIAWVVTGFQLDQHSLDSADVAVNDIVIQYLQGYLNPVQLASCNRVIDALKNTTHPVATIFSTASSSDHEANFQLGSCTQDSDNNLQLSVGAFSYSFQSMQLNTRLYATLRDTVSAKLGNTGKDFIGELPLPPK
ncbi:hypothetical protein BDN70DRAFT_924228 [Pholiota conissans]|uniref:Uncharacterized protein n=1 Tax=Pholiota conissans TaxID=109636 RepID=A0A9P6CVU6_9AGAR|nr:hypothetical protein BDN70DRAFT_924228 [Pholiota conissans]